MKKHFDADASPRPIRKRRRTGYLSTEKHNFVAAFTQSIARFADPYIAAQIIDNADNSYFFLCKQIVC